MKFTELQLIGIRIRLARVKKGLSGEELATTIGVQKSQQSKIEKGKGNDIGILRLRKIAKALDVELTYLISEQQLTEDEMTRLREIHIG